MRTRAPYHCPQCGRSTLHFREVEPPNHVLHALISLFMCGLWVPVWMLIAAIGGSASPWMCSRCGSSG